MGQTNSRGAKAAISGKPIPPDADDTPVTDPVDVATSAANGKPTGDEDGPQMSSRWYTPCDDRVNSVNLGGPEFHRPLHDGPPETKS